MEWVETTGKTVDEAKERALDQLGVARDDAEFDIVEEARTGLFGRLKNEARVRARVKPAQVRPKHDRRRSAGKSKRGGRNEGRSKRDDGGSNAGESGREAAEAHAASTDSSSDASAAASAPKDRQRSSSNGQRGRSKRPRTQKEHAGMDDNRSRERTDHDRTDHESTVTPQEVGDAAAGFMAGLTSAFGAEATAEVEIDGTEIDVRVAGDELGLLVGPGGRTLNAVQDLARVSSQRRLGDHETRLRIDIGGYREKRKDALEKFAAVVAAQVIESGSTKALEPMSSADRKVVHDAINEIDGVTSRSDGDDPNRRVVISPA